MLVLSACSGEHEQRTENDAMPDSSAWCIAVMPTMDCLPFYVASERHFFEEAGASVWLKTYQAQMDVDTALQRSRVVGAATDLARVERLRQEGLQLEVVSQTILDWQLISKRTSRISKWAQLDDKMLAMTRYSGTDLLTDLVVDSAKLKSERVFRIQVNDVSVRLGMLQSDIMDAMFLPEPQATAARNLRGRVMLDTRKMDIRLGAMAFIADSIKRNRAQLTAIFKAYDRAVDSLNEQGIKSYSYLMEKYLGVSKQTIDSLPDDFKFRHSEEPRHKDLEMAKNWWNKRVESMKYVERRYIQ
jgi:NitT/TauT family transport system substrate-binding protein